jgi:hypothetical protein
MIVARQPDKVRDLCLAVMLRRDDLWMAAALQPEKLVV